MKNIQEFKGRTLQAGDKIKAYFDLHRHTFSLQVGNLVFGKADEIVLKDVTFKVNEKKRQQVIEEGRKNVHAKVHGTIVEGTIQAELREATYNPYKYESFVDKETKQPIESAGLVLLKNKKIFYAA